MINLKVLLENFREPIRLLTNLNNLEKETFS